MNSFRPLSGNEFKNNKISKAEFNKNVKPGFRPLSGNEFKNAIEFNFSIIGLDLVGFSSPHGEWV